MTPTPTMDPALSAAATSTGQAIGSGLAVLLGIALLSGFIFGGLCAELARRRGRSQIAGFIAGFFFTLIAVFYYALAGDTAETRVRKEDAARAKIRREEEARQRLSKQPKSL